MTRAEESHPSALFNMSESVDLSVVRRCLTFSLKLYGCEQNVPTELGGYLPDVVLCGINTGLNSRAPFSKFRQRVKARLCSFTPEPGRTLIY